MIFVGQGKRCLPLPNQAPAPNRRPRFPSGAWFRFQSSFCAPPSSPAAVGEARRYAT